MGGGAARFRPSPEILDFGYRLQMIWVHTKIDLGHLIFSRDRWSAGTGVHALGQPFYCIVKEAA
jgi:hypothetical protein